MNTESAPHPSDDVIRRIRGEYTEMPGLRVTQQQAQRLWALDDATARLALDVLVDAGFLRRIGAYYMRATEGPQMTIPMRMAKAGTAAGSLSRRVS